MVGIDETSPGSDVHEIDARERAALGKLVNEVDPNPLIRKKDVSHADDAHFPSRLLVRQFQ